MIRAELLLGRVSLMLEGWEERGEDAESVCMSIGALLEDWSELVRECERAVKEAEARS